MRRKLLPVVLGLGMMSGSFVASATNHGQQNMGGCGEPSWTSTEIGGNVYTFVSAVKCTLKGSISNYKELLEVYKDALSTRPAPNAVISTSIYNEKIDLTLKEYYNTEHGEMTYETDNLLAFTSSGFSYESKAKKFIKLTSHTDATKSILLKVTVENAPQEEVEIVVSKEINVKKPFGVPENWFLKPAKAGLQKDLAELATFHADLVSKIL